MDPDANLRELRDLAARGAAYYEGEDVDCDSWGDMSAYRLIELIQALDEWLSKGGFLPRTWRANQ